MTTQADKVKFWTTGYNYWRSTQGGVYPDEFAPPQMFEDSPCAGFYRKGIYEKVPNKRAKRIGWDPVAIWRDADGLHAMVGTTMADPMNIWTHVCGNPISEEWYRAVDRGEGWPDDHNTEAPSAMVKRMAADIPDEPETPAERIARELKAEQAHLPTYAKIESDDVLPKARSLQQRFLDIKSEAKKHYDAANRPLLDQQEALRKVWFAIRDEADAGAVTVRTAMETWNDFKVEQAAKAAAEEAKKAVEHAEAVRKAEAANQPAPPPLMEAKPNVPPPSTTIKGGTGRAGNMKVKPTVTAIDVEKAFAMFKETPEVHAVLMTLAQKAVDAGLAVPGATVEQKSSLR